MSKLPVVIVGSGLAGYTVAREFRKLDSETPVVIISADHAGFYSKPMLSNAFAQNKSADALLIKTAEQMSAEVKADIHGLSLVSAIAPARNELTANGEVIQFSKLVLALGADPIRIAMQGSGADGVLSVNNLDDFRNFRLAIEGKKDIAILGAGLIGCEFANDLASAGFNVHVVDLAPQVLGRLLPAEAAVFMESQLGAIGITFHLSTSIHQVERNNDRYYLTLSNGETIEADAVLSAVGLKPRTALASDAAIKVNRGIVVNKSLQTSHKDIYALGDCAEVDGQVLPFIMPMMHAARVLASTLAGNFSQVNYPAMPVAVKTPTCPAVILPPILALRGTWVVKTSATGVKAMFQDASGALLGFALLGDAVSEKNSLTRMITPHT